MIAICSAFRRPSGSMRTIDIAAVLHRKEAHEERTEDHYHGPSHTPRPLRRKRSKHPTDSPSIYPTVASRLAAVGNCLLEPHSYRVTIIFPSSSFCGFFHARCMPRSSYLDSQRLQVDQSPAVFSRRQKVPSVSAADPFHHCPHPPPGGWGAIHLHSLLPHSFHGWDPSFFL